MYMCVQDSQGSAVCFCGSWCAGTYSSIGPGRFSLVAAASSRLLLTLWWPHHPPGESPCSRPHARDQEGMTRGSLRCVSCTPTQALTAPSPGPPGPISLFQSPSAGAGGRRRTEANTGFRAELHKIPQECQRCSEQLGGQGGSRAPTIFLSAAIQH